MHIYIDEYILIPDADEDVAQDDQQGETKLRCQGNSGFVVSSRCHTFGLTPYPITTSMDWTGVILAAKASG